MRSYYYYPYTQTDQLEGHNDAVQAVLFDQRGTMMISGSSDGIVAMWE